MITPIIHRFDEVSSTNDIAREMAIDGAPEGTLVLAKIQSNGRGRRGRGWSASSGLNILMSVILRPDKPLKRYSELSFVAAVAVAECLRDKCGLAPSLKWPNDVLVGDRKTTGILVEIEHGAAVIGIGINVNQLEFPDELAGIATSVAIEHGECMDIDMLTNALIEKLFACYELSFEEILARWRKYMWGLGRSVEVITTDGTVSGAIAGIDSDGALLIDSDGSTRRIIAAEAIKVAR